MNSKVSLSVFIFAISFSAIYGQLSCSFSNTFHGYTCSLLIVNPDGLNNFDTVIGMHVPPLTDDDVQAVLIRPGSNSTNIPSILCQQYRNLRHIAISSIGIQRIDDFSFENCPSLTFLDLFNNQITTVHENAFLRNTQLQTLYLYNNPITTLPENLFQSQSGLVTLWLMQNRIADLPPNIFRPLQNLNELDIRTNQIRNLRPEWFANLPRLTNLVLTNNFIADLPSNVFTPLSSLTWFTIQNNDLTIVHGNSFENLPILRSINLSGNRIDAIDENLIDFTGVSFLSTIGNICSSRSITDNSITRAVMRAELSVCIRNYNALFPSK